MGMETNCREEHAFALRVRRLLALALVPLPRYRARITSDKAQRLDGMLEFIRYIQDTAVGQRVNNRARIKGQFPYNQWNMRE